MSRACLTATTCLNERQRAMRLNGPLGWGIKCMDCIEGCARQMDSFRPEPDIAPSPQRDVGKVRVKRIPATCTVCGKGVNSRAKLCKKCWGLSRRVNHAKCSVGKCRAKARRGTLCCTHYYATVAADKLAKKRERQRVADAKYRGKEATA